MTDTSTEALTAERDAATERVTKLEAFISKQFSGFDVDEALVLFDVVHPLWPAAPRSGVVKPTVDELARALISEWKRVDPNSDVSKHMTSYVANFADMARVALALTTLPASSIRDEAPTFEDIESAIWDSTDEGTFAYGSNTQEIVSSIAESVSALFPALKSQEAE